MTRSNIITSERFSSTGDSSPDDLDRHRSDGPHQQLRQAESVAACGRTKSMRSERVAPHQKLGRMYAKRNSELHSACCANVRFRNNLPRHCKNSRISLPNSVAKST